MDTPRLRDLSFAARLGVTGVVLSLLLGVWASLRHLEHHHENRDGVPGVSLDDLQGAYHGLASEAPLVRALTAGHPEDLPDAERELLLGWLGGDRISDDYDNLDLGDAAPAEVVDRACNGCHARQAEDGDGIGQEIPLEYWDDVEAVAFSRRIEAVPEEILWVSMHTHALSLGVVTLALGALVLLTRWPGAFRSGVLCVAGVALFGDLSAWWLARSSEAFVLLIAACGGLWCAATVVGCLGVLADLWLPRPRRAD